MNKYSARTKWCPSWTHSLYFHTTKSLIYYTQSKSSSRSTGLPNKHHKHQPRDYHLSSFKLRPIKFTHLPRGTSYEHIARPAFYYIGSSQANPQNPQIVDDVNRGAQSSGKSRRCLSYNIISTAHCYRMLRLLGFSRGTQRTAHTQIAFAIDISFHGLSPFNNSSG